MTTTYVLGTGGRDAEVGALGHFAYLAHELGSGLSQMVAFAEHDDLQFPDVVTEQFRKTAAALAELHQACTEETMRRDLEQP